MSAPTGNIYWRNIPVSSRAWLRGKPGTRYYVVVLEGSNEELVPNWSGNDAREAQRWLDRMVSRTKQEEVNS